jgi:acyl-CoA reductase-like NAD-dependent aldehyde dehydrogenase
LIHRSYRIIRPNDWRIFSLESTLKCEEKHMDCRVDLDHHELFIDGKHVAPSSDEYSIDLNPATEEPIAEVAQGGKADVDLAVNAARAALKVWGGMRAAERGRILQRAASLLEEHQEELIELESLDAGKPLAGVRRQDMAAVIDTVRYYAGWCDKITGQVIPARPDALTYTVREPVGVVAAIVPWNFPLMIGMWKIAPALACGCTWSADTGRVHRMAAGLKAGTVWINTYGYTDVRLPWGGSGESGFGREHGESAIENFTEPKAVWLALDQLP